MCCVLRLDTRKNFLLVSTANRITLFLEHLSHRVVYSNNRLHELIPHRAQAGAEVMQSLLQAEGFWNLLLTRTRPRSSLKEATRFPPGCGPCRQLRSSSPEKGGGMGLPPSLLPWGSGPDDVGHPGGGWPVFTAACREPEPVSSSGSEGRCF